MWGSRGARLWRSLERIEKGSRGNQEPRWQALGACVQNLRSGKAEISNVALRSLPSSGLSGGWLQDGKQFKSLPIWQQNMSIATRIESLRATSDSDRYPGGLQNEPLLRPKEVEVEDDIDGEPLEEASDGSEMISVEPSELELQLQNSPRRKQRFILQKALKIRNLESEGRPQKRGFTMKVVDVNRTCKVTKGGGILNFTAMVICGNGDGVAGFGKGKSAEISSAVDKAYARALRNLHYFERFEGHTIFHEKTSKYGKTKIYLWPAQSGTGMRASHTVGGILRLAGFKDVKTKVVGSRHPHNTVKAVFKALSEIETPEETAEREGRERVKALHA